MCNTARKPISAPRCFGSLPAAVPRCCRSPIGGLSSDRRGSDGVEHRRAGTSRGPATWCGNALGRSGAALTVINAGRKSHGEAPWQLCYYGIRREYLEDRRMQILNGSPGRS